MIYSEINRRTSIHHYNIMSSGDLSWSFNTRASAAENERCDVPDNITRVRVENRIR